MNAGPTARRLQGKLTAAVCLLALGMATPLLATPLLATLALAGSLGAQRIGEHRWGFDGRIVPHRFNLLSVDIHNDTDKPIDKILRLSKSGAPGLTTGAPLVARCYLGPGARRTMQFQPFIASAATTWSLSWVEGGARGANLGSVQSGIGATVLLEEDPFNSRKLSIRTFPPNLLPSTSLAMSTLRGVVIDTAPDLSAGQRAALLEWLSLGGEIHLLLRGDSFPEFEDELVVLNGDGQVSIFGQGRILRHQFDRFALLKEVPEPLYGGPTFKSFSPPKDTPLSQKLRERMKTTATPHSGWALLFVLTIVYLILIGPVFYRLSTNRLSWPFSLLALSAMIGLATWTFSVMGERGYGEVDQLNSWSYARLVGEGEYEVTRFVDVFATKGGDFTFGEEKGYQLFSSAQESEFVNGTIHNGPNGKYTVDIPRVSNRLVVHKNKTTGPNAAPRFVGGRFQSDIRFDRLISVSETFVTMWHRDGSNWIPRRRNLESWIDSYESDWMSVSLEDIAIERMALRNMNLRRNRPATSRGHHVFFCQTGEVHFPITGNGPRPTLGTETGTTVFRFDLFEQN